MCVTGAARSPATALATVYLTWKPSGDGLRALPALLGEKKRLAP